MSTSDYSDRDCTVFVGSIDRKVTEEIIYELFLQAGPLTRVNIAKDKESGAQKSFGFVTFTSPISVPYAIDLLDGTYLYGQRINVRPQTGSSTPVNPVTPATRGPGTQSPLLDNPIMRGSPVLTQVAMMPQVIRRNSYEHNNYGGQSPPVHITPQHRNFQPVRQNSTGHYSSQNYHSHQHSSRSDYRRSNSYQEHRSYRH